MSRTTLDIDLPVLRELKRLQHREGKSLGRLASDLLAHAMAVRRSGAVTQEPFVWTTRPMRALVELTDKDALYAALERDPTGDR